MSELLQEQDVAKSYRILGLGATTLVGAALDGDVNYMAAAWAGVSDFDKGYVVVAKDHYTRKLIEKSGRFILCYPGAGIVETVMKLGTVSKNDESKKLELSGAQFIEQEGFSLPLIKGCSAYLEYEVIKEPHMEDEYDMFFGKCLRVVTDSRVYRDNHWHFDSAPDELRTLHYVAGGHFYTIGKELVLPQYGD